MGCYLIGQYRYPDRGEQLVQAEQTQDENVNQSVWSEFDLEFEGSEKTSDNPWGYTTGIIDTDFAGECILLNPNTSVTLNIPENLDSLNLAFKIHPWVAESSDGAGIIVQYLDLNQNIVKEICLDVINGEEWFSYSIESIDENDTNVRLTCNNGKNNNDTADWVIIALH